MLFYIYIYIRAHVCIPRRKGGSLVLFCLEPLLSLGLAGSFWSCFIRVLVSSESPEAKVGQL